MYSRRKLLTLTLLFAAALSPALAQVPRTISFQGVLADASGVLVPDGSTQMTIAIYDVPAGGTALFSETLTVPVVRGVFNAVIGSSNPNGIPTSVAFDKQYWLGVRVGTGAELAPRTAFTSVPYALNAAMAERAQTAVTADSADWAMTAITSDTAGAVRGGHVISFNGQQGAIEILGAGATTVTRNGSQFIIRSTDTSSGGIRRIDNFDGSIVIDPPQGPFVTMFIREGGIQTHHIRDLSITTAKIIDLNVTTPKLANNAVTAAKVNTEGAPDGFALISNGTNTPVWENPLTANIPYAETFNSPLTLWWLTNTGTGGGGRYTLNNAGSSATALIGETNGTGVGVLGTHSATTGTAAGVRGESNSTDANAVAVQ
ncbi:MAG TPA: hypothetical protein VNA88_08380, partial [Candidatus Kapabacteria bacterium]|nr:hypothetical protein [Candidatus Kapabacteria bacterium]